ncbi:TetR family transcriptional regulator [Agrococcus sediminis]|uniref:TetR/AcrR family transcriptional regulator n=1 Tax=Agrococcus sediminis TaxID=2599924 RepID=UPI003810E219
MARSPADSDAIARAAARLFVDRGYAATTVRDIAAAADVDPAVVIRRFGSKESLFLRTMESEELARAWRATLDGPLGTFGERCAAALLDSRQDTRGVFLALLRASDAEGIGSRLRDAHEARFVAPLRERLGGGDAADLRARLAAAAAGGLLYALWAVGDEALDADRDALVRRYGAVIQAAIA